MKFKGSFYQLWKNVNLFGVFSEGQLFRKSYLRVFLLLILVPFYISCTPKLIKTDATPLYIAEPTKFFNDLDNLTKEAFTLYYQSKFEEAMRKLESSQSIISNDTSKSTIISLYIFLAFFQEKSGDSDKAAETFESVKNSLQELKQIPTELELLGANLSWIANRLWLIDRLEYWERLRPLSIYLSKTAEAFVVSQIAEVYLSLNNFDKAYSFGIEALKLAREIEDNVNQTSALMTVSGSLIALGRLQEAESLLQEFLPKIQNEKAAKALILGQLGLVYSALGNENEMTKTFQDAIAIAHSTGVTDLEAMIEFKFGLAYIIPKKHQEAIQELTAALGLYKKSEDDLKVASIKGFIANTYFVAGLFEEANKYASQAAELFHMLGNRAEEVKNLLIAGDSLTALNKVEEAISVLEKALYIQVEAKDRNGALWTFGIIIGLMKKEGWFENAKRALLTGLDKYTSIFGDKEGEATIRIELSNVYDELGLFSEELEQLYKVLNINRQLKKIKEEILILLKLSRVYSVLNDNENRFYSLALAEEIGTEFNDPFVKLNILSNTAAFYQDIGDIAEALQRNLEALEISRMIGKQAEIIQLRLVGYFFNSIDEYAKALDYFEQGLKLAKESGNRSEIAKELKGIGFCYVRMKKYKDAIQVWQEELDIQRALKAKSDEYFTLELIGSALVEIGDYENALQILQECLNNALQSENTKRGVSAYSQIGVVYSKQGKYLEAIEAYKKAIEGIEFLSSKIKDVQHEMRFFEKKLGPYDGIVEAFYNLYAKGGYQETQFAEEALYFAEKSKAQVWEKQLAMSRAVSMKESIPIELRNEEENLIAQHFINYKDYMYISSRYGASDKELKKKWEEVENVLAKLKSFYEKIRKQYPQYVFLQYDRFFGFSELAELEIQDGETVILYKLGLERSYAWVIGKRGNKNEILKFIRLPITTAEVEKISIKLLMPFIKTKYNEFDLNIAADLFDKILKPVLEGVTISKHLIVIPDGILNVVPFELLVTKIGCGKDFKKPCFFGDQFNVKYYPSATILTFNRQAMPQTSLSHDLLFAVGDPIYSTDDERLDQSQISLLHENENEQKSSVLVRSGRIRKGAQDQCYSFDRLKNTGIEVNKIRDIFKNSYGKEEVLTGYEAREGNVKSKDLTQYRYLHFAVHGMLAYDIPYLKEPALVLGIYPPEDKEDGFLTLSEIYSLRLNADLVTLSACNTGLGFRYAGEGVVGLSRAFMNVGARSVLVSLWEVADESTALFMEEFYRLLNSGMEKTEALEKAKYKLRQMGYENPYFWAPFILIGD